MRPFLICETSCGRVLLLLRRLRGNDQAGNLVVRRPRDDSLALKLGLVGVRTAGDDLLRLGVADARKRLKLIGRGRVDVYKTTGWVCRDRRCGRRLFRSGLRKG